MSKPTSLTQTSTQASANTPVIALGRALPILFAALFGVLLVAGTGFAQPNVIHNAAHDTRHSLGFPCH